MHTYRDLFYILKIKIFSDFLRARLFFTRYFYLSIEDQFILLPFCCFSFLFRQKSTYTLSWETSCEIEYCRRRQDDGGPFFLKSKRWVFWQRGLMEIYQKGEIKTYEPS